MPFSIELHQEAGNVWALDIPSNSGDQEKWCKVPGCGKAVLKPPKVLRDITYDEAHEAFRMVDVHDKNRRVRI